MKLNISFSIKYHYILTFVVVVLVAYLCGFASGVKKIFPYKLAKGIQLKLNDGKFNTGSLENCTIPKLTTLPESFSMIVGHAYGSPTNAKYEDFIADSILEFTIQHTNNIQSIVFTGDVFSVPSKQKWKHLFDEFSSMNVFVAPGNHDIARPDSKDVFKDSNFIRQNYPYEVKINGLNVVLDDSVSSEWVVGGEVTDQISNAEGQNIIVARHYIPIIELLEFSNSHSPPIPLPPIEKFIKKFPKHKSVTWIMGDGGAFDDLPRFTCHKYDNHRFIVNGIGEIKGDVILLISNGKIYQYLLK